MLSKVLRLFPSQEYAEQLSAVIIRRGGFCPELAHAHTVRQSSLNGLFHIPLRIAVYHFHISRIYSIIQGSTAQNEEVTERGGVLYAYGPGNKTYLYQENAELVDFRIGPAFLGLPEYEDWRGR